LAASLDKPHDISHYLLMALVKIGKAAEMLGVAVQTLHAWEASGELIPDRRSNGGTRYYDLAKIDSFTRQLPPEPPPSAAAGPEPTGGVLASPEPTSGASAISNVPLSAEAAVLFREFIGDVEEEIGPGGEFDSIRLFARTLPEQAACLGAAVAACRDHQFTELSLADFQQGIQLACSLAYEAKRLVARQ
jgi:hypothetical protein